MKNNPIGLELEKTTQAIINGENNENIGGVLLSELNNMIREEKLTLQLYPDSPDTNSRVFTGINILDIKDHLENLDLVEIQYTYEVAHKGEGAVEKKTEHIFDAELTINRNTSKVIDFHN